MEDEWAQHPPVHHLVAAYLGHEPPPPTSPDEPTDADDADDAPARADVWMQSGMGAIAGPEAARTASSADDAIAAFERMFFGEVKDVADL